MLTKLKMFKILELQVELRLVFKWKQRKLFTNYAVRFEVNVRKLSILLFVYSTSVCCSPFLV